MRLFTMAVLGAFAVSAQAAELGGSYNEILDNARAEGELHFMASGETFGGQGTMSQLQDAFNKKFEMNMALRFTPGPSMPAMAARLQQEAEAGAPASTDLYLGNLASIANLDNAGVLLPIDWSSVFPDVTPEMEVTDDRGVLVRTSVSGIVYNSTQFDEESAPKSYTDLVDPERSAAWKGALATPPYHDWIVVQALNMPREDVLAYTRELAPLVSGFLRYGEEERVVSGEFAVMTSTGDAPGYSALWQDRGAPLDFVIGTSPAPTDYFQVAVPSNSSHPNLAALFAAFLTSDEAQGIIDAASYQGSHLSPHTSVAKFIQSSGVELLPPEQLNEFFASDEYRSLYGEVREILAQ